ncbi:MAG: hypothetical protein KF745_00560 [Phycisphaeraceae bacterium]|nr:hypothetical protein [Phycisphaeraceae bacterium]
MKTTNTRAKSAIVEISPSRLEVSVFSSGKPAIHTFFLDQSEWGDNWPGVLRGLSDPLANLVQQSGLVGAAPTVVYVAPTSAVGVFSCPASAGKASAATSAMLGLAGVCPFPLEGQPSGVRHLGTDKPGADGAAGVQVHNLGAADTDASVQAIADLCGRAGLAPICFIPAAAAATADAVRLALEASAKGGVHAVFWLGTQVSVLAVANAGRLRLVRNPSLGTDLFVEALIRPIRARSSDSQPPRDAVTLTRDQARELLARAGIPAAEQVVDEARGIHGAGLLPLMQPVLQRLSVEVKQSLRFGLEDAEREALSLSLAGPGSLLPNLPQTLARQTGLSLGAEQTSSDRDAHGLAAAVRAGESVLPILRPFSMEQASTFRTTRRTVWVGLAAAAAVVAADIGTSWMALSHANERVTQLKNQVARDSATTPEQVAAEAAREKVLALREAISTQMGDKVDWSAFLTLLADTTPENIRFSSVEVGFSGRRACTLTGYLDGASGAEAASALQAYMSSLAAVPLVANVSLGTTQRSQRDGRPVQQFELSVLLLGLPSNTVISDKDAGQISAGER